MVARQRHNRLEEAMTNLMQSQAALVAQQTGFLSQQAAFLSQQAAFSKQMAELEARTAERFDEIRTILIRHEHMLQALPDAIRDKIGFRRP